jgi:hypothetical protein
VGSLLLYLLLAANAALVWSEFRFGDPAMSLNSRIALGLGYALAPLVMASLSAGAITYYYTTPPTLDAFLLNLEITWTLTLIVAVLLLLATLRL